MFLCRSGRFCAAALDPAFKSPGSFLVRAGPKRVTLTLRKGRHAGPWCRPPCAHLGGPGAEPHPGHSWQPPRPPLGGLPAAWGHRARPVATIAATLPTGVRAGAGCLCPARPPLVHSGGARGGGEPGTGVVFTGDRGLATARDSSTAAAAAAKRSDAGEEQSNKGDEQNLKDVSSVSSSTQKAPGEPEPEGGKSRQRLKKVFKEYGAVGISFHIGISLVSLGMFYLLISSGVDMVAMLCKLGFSEAVIHSKMAAETSTFVLAYAIHKLLAPVRISTTIVSVPLIVRYLRKIGLFKPPHLHPDNPWSLLRSLI